ncbi:hypothetical protein QDA00_gp17 [Microbacterium phage Matzah]|uniref:Uncharacterized protein n=1 Tax=Microbacterium phage Matzah TaxID=2686228 RepID=A0A6B9L6I0_9CAUD|nr:hypothetical protein QDA00_gp17 [Microbacterium phage Matzah]QHB37086.1 hypothetical protein SEA_MATZAH_93 [Microbacterium phage Matzah]
MMPEDIPEAPARLTEDDALRRASDWTDFRRDYASHDDATRSREYAAFCAGWDARHLDPTLTPAQEAAIERVRHMIEANSHVTASITEALYTDATERADADALAGLSDRRRADVEAVREKIAEAATGEPEGAEPLPEHDHDPIQHRDGKVPWCHVCGLDRDYNVPHGRFGTRREARDAALRERGQALAAAATAGQVSTADLARAAHIAAGGNPDDLLASGGGLRRPIRDEPQA